MDETGNGEDSTPKIERSRPDLKVVSLAAKKDVPIMSKVKELLEEASKNKEAQSTTVAIIILSGPEHLYVRPVSVGEVSSVALVGLLEVSKHILMQNNIEYE